MRPRVVSAVIAIAWLGALAGAVPASSAGTRQPAAGSQLWVSRYNGPINGVDQRGTARPQAAHCDIGAFEGALQPPSVTGQAALSVTDTAATVGASINANGLATTYRLSYGTTASYGQETAALDLGADSAAHAVSQLLSGLAPSTTYHFQVVATNAGCTTAGPDTTFTTIASTTPPEVAGGIAQNVMRSRWEMRG